MPRFQCVVGIGLVLALGSGQGHAQTLSDADALRRLFPGTDGAWADSVLGTLTLDQKIGQLMMVPAYTAKGTANLDAVEAQVERYGLGGIIFMQGTPLKQVAAANRLQSRAKLPLLVAQDAEWGAAMRLDSLTPWPRNLTLGAVGNDSLLYRFGQSLALECRSLGVHLNFAPVVDVNNNPANPVINVRSFGDDPHSVARAGRQVMRGLQDHGVMANAKHFPGHGDTNADSHYRLPVIRHPADRLRQLELLPFAQLVQQGVQTAMVAHLHIPALDSTPLRPSTFSPPIVTGILRRELGFEGLVFTDALNMKGSSGWSTPGEREVQALLAGNDVLLFPTDPAVALPAIRAAVAQGRLPLEQLEASVRRVLWAKEWLWLHKNRYTPPAEALQWVQRQQHDSLRRSLYRAALTLAKNRNELLPLRNLGTQRVAYVQSGRTQPGELYLNLRKHGRVDFFALPANLVGTAQERLREQLAAYDVVVVGVYGLHNQPGTHFGCSAAARQLVHWAAERNLPSTVVLMGTPYALEEFPEAQAALVAYEDVPEAQIKAVEVIVGASAPQGHLPVQLASGGFEAQAAYKPLGSARLGSSSPEAAGLDPAYFAEMDRLLEASIADKAMPGCALLVAHRGQVIYEKGYGYTTYLNQEAIDPYAATWDLASVTKVMATTLMAMKLYDEGRLDLNAPLQRYLPELAGDDKGLVTPASLLRHDAGFPAWYPFYVHTLTPDSLPSPHFFRTQESDAFSIPVSGNLFMRSDGPDWFWQQCQKVRLVKRQKGKVLYSDFSMIFLAKALERIAGTTLEGYMDSVFYQPLGMNRTCFNPGAKCWTGQFPPTEENERMRNGNICAYVHDANASLLGGVAGHAGLFSNVYDLAKALQMLVNGGTYGGIRFLQPSTIALFARQQRDDSRRGLGWDKPDFRKGWYSPAPKQCSPGTIGHEGFTGTCIWADPEHQLVFVLLANRTWPDRENRRYLNSRVRISVFQLVFDALSRSGQILASSEQ